MSYTPTNWATGDVITAEKLNNMESGIDNAGMFVITVKVNNSDVIQSVDKTFEDTLTAINNGLIPVAIIKQPGEEGELDFTFYVLPLTKYNPEEHITFTLNDVYVSYGANSKVTDICLYYFQLLNGSDPSFSVKVTPV